jgi:thiamine pyrophosphate-dependent acetolactate synthase large subunit-like protein
MYDVWQTSLDSPDFIALAEQCVGARGFRVTQPDQLVGAVEAGIATAGPRS